MQTDRFSVPKLLMIASITTGLAACGGGGGDSSSQQSLSSEHSSSNEHSKSDDDSSFATSSNAATNAVAGQALYGAYCASCHGTSYASAKDYASTLNAIARNKGGMGYLSASIKTEQANDIATYLTYGVSTAPTPTPTPPPTLSNQTITFNSPGDQMMGGTALALVASSSSGLRVTFASSTPTVCMVNGANLNLLAVGTCTLTAAQLGDATFAAASPVNVSFSVKVAAGPGLSAQSITFASPGNQLQSSVAPTLVATASSGLAVSFASATPSICNVNASALTWWLPGTCTVVANQAGNTTFAAAAPVANSFYVIAPNAADGKLAYNLAISGLSCASCHGVPGSQATSRILAAANADLVLSRAILNNLGGMGVLSGRYTQQQILDIAAYLATPGI
jgi:mono/diheme cytochrome c family protein